ncbi:MAG TPA: protease pro-enzyme activation domain-containing protein [Candidatus Acidoferrales bacterium]|nr:protease pro-enzyme activation domain-containing protein [Candidatus Acidoferrales bacterium]
MRTSHLNTNKVLLAFALFSLVAVRASAQTSNVQPRITAAIDNSSRFTIAHSTHPLARPAFDTGALDGATPMNRMILMLGASPEQDQQLRTFLDSQQTQGSPDYHHWLTPDEFGQRFGPAPQDIQTVTAWLQQQGFSVDRVARSGRFIQFSGTSAQVETAFRTRMRHYQVNGEAHVANASDISIPAALAPVVRGVASLNNFFPKPSLIHGPKVRRAGNRMYEVVSPDANLKNQVGTLIHALAPADFAAIYDLNPLYTAATPLNGSGVTIAVVAVSDFNVQDVADFRTVFGLPATTTSNPNVIVNGEDPGDVSGPDEEATIDTEWSGAVAPDATIDVVISADTLISSGVDLSGLFIVDQNLAQVINVSFNACEAGLGGTAQGNDNSFYNALWQQAAAQGMSVFVAAGDTGAAGCDPNQPVPPPGAINGPAVNGFASTWYDTAVGGTEFNEAVAPASTFWNAADGVNLESAIGYIPEMVWNESCTVCINGDDGLGAGSGGLSSIYAVPPWQMLSITGLTGAGFTTRALPDVSLSAAEHDGHIECFQASCEPTNSPSFFVNAGTSFSSPAFAGIMAIVDQKMGGPQGLANYVLYSLAAAENFGSCNSSTRTNPAVGTACVFNDVVAGNNSVPGQAGFNAVTGYDLATGLGSVDANNLVKAWSTAAAAFKGSQTAITSTSPSPINIIHGQNVTVNVAVQKANGGAGPTGNVALITDQTVTGVPGTSTIGGLILGLNGFNGSLGSSGSSDSAGTGPINFLPGGTYNLKATYPGDGTFAGSTSSPISVNVAKENSFITLFTFQPPLTNGESPSTSISIPYGTPVGVEGLVSGASAGNQLTNSGDGIATGTLTFTDSMAGVNLGGAIALNSEGEALLTSCATPAGCFAVGTNTVNASYNGTNDPSFNSGSTPAVGGAVTVTVTKAPTFTSILPSSTTVASGGMVTLTATVETQSAGLAPSAPTSVQFLNSGVVIATVPVTRAPGSPSSPLWLVASGIILFLAYVAMTRPRTRGAYAYSGPALLALLATVLLGCGGGSGGGGGGGGTVQIGAVTLDSSTNGSLTTAASVIVHTTLTTTFPSSTKIIITANYPGDTNYASTAPANQTSVTITVQ